SHVLRAVDSIQTVNDMWVKGCRVTCCGTPVPKRLLASARAARVDLAVDLDSEEETGVLARILCRVRNDLRGVARFHDLRGHARRQDGRNGCELEHPALGLAFTGRHVHRYVDVRVGPANLRDHTFGRDRLLVLVYLV